MFSSKTAFCFAKGGFFLQKKQSAERKTEFVKICFFANLTFTLSKFEGENA